MIAEQSKSSWEIKKVIEGIKSRLEFFTTVFEKINIPSMFENINIPRPNFDSVKDSIKGTFSNIKDKVGNMFGSNGEK